MPVDLQTYPAVIRHSGGRAHFLVAQEAIHINIIAGVLTRLPIFALDVLVAILARVEETHGSLSLALPQLQGHQAVHLSRVLRGGPAGHSQQGKSNGSLHHLKKAMCSPGGYEDKEHGGKFLLKPRTTTNERVWAGAYLKPIAKTAGENR